MNLKDIAAAIPDYEHFLTIDELNASTRRLVADFPDLVSTRIVGTARSGEPIELITIQGGPLQAFVFGGPHPNEPIGTMTIEFLTRRLCEDAALREELGYTWHFIKCIDSDGMRLNEGWFKGPYTPTNYARHFFRPAPFDQVEWTFPIDYKSLHFDKPMPETRALMAVIDELKPTLLYSLHNAGFGGVYYYATGGDENLFKQFAEIPTWYDLALDLGEPEVSYAKVLAPAIYGILTSKDIYDHLVANGAEDPAKIINSGASSGEYAAQYGSYLLIVELPYYDDPRVNDMSTTTTLRRDAILEGLSLADEFDDWILARLEQVRPELKQETLISRAVMAFLGTGKDYRDIERKWAQTAEETNRLATQAEVFSNLLGNRFYRLLLAGMFARVLDGEIAAGNTAEIIRTTRDAARDYLNDQGAALENDLNYRALPIRSLVGVQVCAGLATAEYLRNSQK